MLAFMVIVGISIIVLSYQQRNPAIMLFANIPALVITAQKGLPFWVGSVVVMITILGIVAAITKKKKWLINNLVIVANVMATSYLLHAYLAAHVTVFQSFLIAVAIALIVLIVALRDGLWRIPALILAAELYALAYSIGFNWTSWLGYALALAIVLGAIFTATLAKGKSKFFVIAALCIALLCLGFALWGNFFNHKNTPKAATPQTANHQTVQKDEKFRQVPAENNKNRVDAGFEKRLAEFEKSGKSPEEAFKLVLLERSANNAQRLAIWANQFGLYNTPNDWKGLVDGEYLSKDGEALYYKLEGSLSGRDVLIQKFQAPTDSKNSGVSNGKFGVSEQNGFTGNRSATKVIQPNGKTTTIADRCGNPLNPGKDLPTVKTDEPLQPKNPSKDVGVNPKVAPWKQDNTGGNPAAGHQVTNENGATKSNGLQADPVADATAAKAAAEKIAADNAAAHAKAIADAKAAAETAAKKILADAKTAAEKAAAEKIIADTKANSENQNHTATTPPGNDW
jgi:hypothetical protein